MDDSLRKLKRFNIDEFDIFKNLIEKTKLKNEIEFLFFILSFYFLY